MGRGVVIVLVLASACGRDRVPGVGDDADAPVAGALELTPPLLDLGDSDVAALSGQIGSFTLRNATDTEVTLEDFAIAGAAAGDFTIISQGCPASLPAGATCGVTIEFRATARDARAATLEITGSRMASAALAGRGVIAADLAIAPGARDFGDVEVGAGGAPFTFTVFNEIADSTIVPSIAGGAGGFSVVGTTCTGTIPLHGTCTIDVALAPPHGGEFRGDLVVIAGAETARAGVVGLSTSPLAITPFTRLFGSMLLGTTGGTETITVRNTTAAETGTLTPALIGAAAVDFTIQSTTCTTLAPDETCDVVVRSTPATRGAKTAQLEITDGAAAKSARATLRADAYSLLVIGSATFPPTVNGQTSARQSYTVINASGTATGAITTQLAGSQFAIASNTCAPGIPPNMSCEIEIEFSPTSTGAASATLSVSASPGGSDDFVVGGNGT